MAQKFLSDGSTSGDGRGTPLDQGARVINDNFTELYAGVPHARLDISNPNLTASWRPDGSGNLCLFVGPAGAADADQLKVASVDKATGMLTLAKSTTISGSLNLSAAGADTGTGTSLFFVGSGAFQTVLAGAALAFHTGPNGSRVERGRIDINGNFGFGTNVPVPRVDVVGSATVAGQANVAARFGAGVTSDLLVGSVNGNTPFIAASGAYPVAIFTNGAERARFTSTGTGFGTSSPSATVHAVGINEVGRFEAANSEAYFVVNQSADPAVTGARPVFQLRKNNVVRLQVSAEGGSVGAGQVYYEALGTSSAHWFFGGSVRPGAHNATTIGAPGASFSTGYFETSPIITSDARTKLTVDGEGITEDTGWGVTPYTEAQLRVSRRMAAGIGLYKTKDAVEKKGLADARQHSGLTVQFGLAACAAEGVDPWSLGIFCRDQITRRVKVTQTVTKQKMEPDEPEAAVEVIDGVPTQVLRERPPRPVFKMEPLIGLDGQPLTRRVQATEEVTEEADVIEVQDGKPVLVKRPVTVKRPAFAMEPVEDENGEAVTRIELAPAESGFPVEKRVPVLYPVPVMVDEPVMHPVPVMVEVPEDVWIDEPAGETLSFRIDELQYFLIAGLVSEA